ncbi:Hypothetical protein, putative [Bodo saltans]|uniref:Uncharacterized protein n=1 Tax=Bodo saltans TaxID=75058 RepID=A0A0S4ITH3_BODSA|nr:Hypothetical protein, putative [Bodo saltans]|eukprot:CUF72730.1 Hypothetical protein, putative [Bodo saltans]
MVFEAVDGCFLHETRKETETTVLRQQAEHHTPPLAAPAQEYYASSTSSSCSVVGWPSHRHGLHLGGGGTTECSIPKHLASPSLSVCSTSATTMQLTTAPTSAASVSLSNESILSPMPPSSSVVSSSAAAFPQRRRRTATTSTTLGACPTAVLASIPSPRHNNSTDDNNNNDDYAPNLILRHTKHAANADHRQLHDKADNVDDDDDESIMSRPRVCPPPQPPSSYHKSDLRFVRDGTGVLLPLFAEAPVSSSPSAPTMSTIAGEAVSSWNGGVISVEALPSPPPPPPSAAQNSLRVSPLTLHVSHQQQLAAGYSLAGRRGVRSSTLHHQQYEAPIQKYPLSIYHHPHNLIPPPPALHRHTMQHPEEDFLFVDDAHDVGEESAGDEDELERCTVLTVGA